MDILVMLLTTRATLRKRNKTKIQQQKIGTFFNNLFAKNIL